jgi:uncharacterized protein
MPIKLYDAFVPGCQQVLHSLSGLMEKGEAYCAETGIAPAELIGTKLAPDMLDLAYQIKSCVVHSVGAIDGAQSGNFSPDTSTPPTSFSGLRAKIDEGLTALAAISPDQIEAMIGRPMAFTIGDQLRWDFTVENFLLSFSQPNFYFHATTAYDLLRMKGVKLGKRDYLGAVRKSV